MLFTKRNLPTGVHGQIAKATHRHFSGIPYGAAMDKELMYSSSKLKNRVADMNDSVEYCMHQEIAKPAFMRKKVSQGLNSDSQG